MKMKKVQKINNIPDKSIIQSNFNGAINYSDSFCIKISNSKNYSIDYLTALLFTSIPRWVQLLLKLRDILVKPFGLATGMFPEQETLNSSLKYKIGDRAIFFTVVDRSSSEIVMAEDDRHLYFKTSLYIEKSIKDHSDTAYLTTLVQFHNFFGRLYFAPVKPFHKIIMRRLLINFSKKLD